MTNKFKNNLAYVWLWKTIDAICDWQKEAWPTCLENQVLEKRIDEVLCVTGKKKNGQPMSGKRREIEGNSIVLDTQPHGQWWPGWSDKDYSWHEKILILFISNCEFYKITFAHNVTMFSVHFALIWKVWTNPFFVSHNPSMCPYNQFCWQLLYAGLLLWKFLIFFELTALYLQNT